jgi:hypothetical protein
MHPAAAAIAIASLVFAPEMQDATPVEVAKISVAVTAPTPEPATTPTPAAVGITAINTSAEQSARLNAAVALFDEAGLDRHLSPHAALPRA